MTNITANKVKELRNQTGSGMMECKQALVAHHGDIVLAAEALRKAGLAKADKKSVRIAAEGTIAIKISDDRCTAGIIEVNCETDFVAKGSEFQNFANLLANLVCTEQPKTISELSNLSIESTTVETMRVAMVAKIGENITIRRLDSFSTLGKIYSYKHGLKIGVLVDMGDADEVLGKDIAMHIVASKPIAIHSSDIPADIIAKEKEIFVAQAEKSEKPEHIATKMVEGMLKKYLQEVSLVEQPFIKDNDTNIQQLLDLKKATINKFTLLAVGEGIDKKEIDFANEVSQQVAAAQGR